MTVTGGRCWEGSKISLAPYTGGSDQQFIIRTDGTIHPVCNEETFIAFSDFKVASPPLYITHGCQTCERRFSINPILV